MHGHIREKKEIFNYVKPKHHNFAMPKHTNVIHDLRALVTKWLFMRFFLRFFSPSRQKE